MRSAETGTCWGCCPQAFFYSSKGAVNQKSASLSYYSQKAFMAVTQQGILQCSTHIVTTKRLRRGRGPVPCRGPWLWAEYKCLMNASIHIAQVNSQETWLKPNFSSPISSTFTTIKSTTGAADYFRFCLTKEVTSIQSQVLVILTLFGSLLFILYFVFVLLQIYYILWQQTTNSKDDI